jgi:hypothetical protein
VIPIGTSGNVVDIVAVGIQKYITQGGVPRDTSHTIQTRYARNEEAAMLSLMDLSRYVDNVIVTQKTLDIRGNVFIGPFNKVEPVNSNVHTNGVLRTEGNSYEVQGFGTYAGSEEVNFDRFAPNDDVNGSASNVYQVDPLRIPRLNLNQLRANASLHYITGDFTINAADFPYVSFDAWALALGAPPQTGTPEGDPFILVVEGDLNLVNLVRLDGHGILAAAGNIRFGKGKGGGGHAGIIGETANYESLLGLYTVGDIEVAGNAELAATLYADGNISFGGTLDLIGGIYASEMEFKVHGNPSILHVRAKDSILYPWFANQPSPNPVRITSSEW